MMLPSLYGEKLMVTSCIFLKQVSFNKFSERYLYSFFYLQGHYYGK